MTVQWTGRLVQDKEAGGYRGLVFISGFPYRMTIKRDMSDAAPAVICTVEIAPDGTDGK